jgi:hypothetical protein
VSDKAKEIYDRLANANPIDVSAAFAPNTENLPLGELTKGLAAFAYANRSANCTSFDWNDFDLPGGCCYCNRSGPRINLTMAHFQSIWVNPSD